MWRTMYKLAKTFSERTAPGRVTDNFKKKIDKFKQHLPILTTICNPGLKDRHWEMVRQSSDTLSQIFKGTVIFDIESFDSFEQLMYFFLQKCCI